MSLPTNLKETHETPEFSTTNSMIPRFSGADSEDVTEFLVNFNRAARFYKFSKEREAEALPLYLTGNNTGLMYRNFYSKSTARTKKLRALTTPTFAGGGRNACQTKRITTGP